MLCCCCCCCQVEAAAKEVAKELAVGLEEGAAAVAPVTTLAERLAATAERGLEVSWDARTDGSR